MEKLEPHNDNGTAQKTSDISSFPSVQSIHVVINQNGRHSDVWAMRPNRVRRIYDDGRYNISNGPTQWIVDEKKNTATRQQSPLYTDAQQQGVDVLDYLFQREWSWSFAGYFSETPQRQIQQDNITYDVYEMDSIEHSERIKFEAIVNVNTGIIDRVSVRKAAENQNESVTVFELKVVEYNCRITEEMFSYQPNENTTVIIKEDPIPEEAPSGEGSSVFGRVVWAKSEKPVNNALITISGGSSRQADGTSRCNFSKRIRTNRQGDWSIAGVPRGMTHIHVKAFALGWPALPSFTCNSGSPLNPSIFVDSQSDYRGIDFLVYKPADLFARITLSVKDENGNPIEGAGAHLDYDGGEFSGDTHQGIDAVPYKNQFTGKDGIFDNDQIVPTNKPVRISVGHKSEFGSIYATRNCQTEPFVIEPQKEYHFDITVPLARKIEVQVLDANKNSVNDIAILALDKDGEPLYTGRGRHVYTGMSTDSEGKAELSGLRPGENFFIAVRRYNMAQPTYYLTPTASAVYPATAPLDMSKAFYPVVFDERPIIIRGSLDIALLVKTFSIHITLSKDIESRLPFVFQRFENTQEFEMQGIPAGKVYVGCRTVIDDKPKWITTPMTLEPSAIYVLKITEQNIKIINKLEI